ncbi:MAG: hypothetical protein JF597_19045 [Streptomyces sp.]|uniref:hypothetical protein n=1 Tax=Streptomyces sp. TaxID=1931 RepID=UPI0025EE812F|nr:hypothetical protein [Streptomyces sp.]MBW8795608.1 hypothetical protein [Streptomyces sp.]
MVDGVGELPQVSGEAHQVAGHVARHAGAPDTDAHGQRIRRCRNCGSHVSTSGKGKPHSPSGKAQ